MYERHKRRYSLCDISKVDRTVDVVLLKVRASPQPPPAFESGSRGPGQPVLGEELRGVCVCVCVRAHSGNCGVGLVILRFLAEYLTRNSGDFRIVESLRFQCHFICFKVDSSAQENLLLL